MSPSAERAETSSAMLSTMYQETLLAHHRAPHNRRALPSATHRGARKNPLCGDALELFATLDGERILDVSFGGRGCSISVASASMLTDVVGGMTRNEALALIDRVEAMLRDGHRASEPLAHGDLPSALDALRGVAPFPARHGCATMPWLALRDALHEHP